MEEDVIGEGFFVGGRGNRVGVTVKRRLIIACHIIEASLAGLFLVLWDVRRMPTFTS